VPRFFFHIHDHEYVADDDGLVLNDVQAAKKEAIRGARDILSEEVKHGRLPLCDRIDVEDEAGTIVATVRFGDTITIER
jgi:hypothetical protein